jgi:hypothetical protein
MIPLIHSEDRPALPAPSAYARHADYILARQKAEADWRLNRSRSRFWLTLLVLSLLSLAALAVILWIGGTK